MKSLLIVELLAQIQAVEQLLSAGTTWNTALREVCCAEKIREWLGHCSMCWSEIGGHGSRINCRIGWFLDSFYCCTFFLSFFK